MSLIQQTWMDFQPVIANKVLPIYQQHEKSFDLFGLHGRRHITRSLIWAELMGRFYYHLGETDIDFYGIHAAVAFHDAGRAANGRDIWESQSAQICKDFLLEQGKTDYYATTISNTILHKKQDITSKTSQIIYDADVLEILRLFVNTKNGLKKFRQNEWLFLNHPTLDNGTSNTNYNSIRAQFLEEVWQFILETERMKNRPNNQQFLPFYMSEILQNPHRFPLLNDCYQCCNHI